MQNLRPQRKPTETESAVLTRAPRRQYSSLRSTNTLGALAFGRGAYQNLLGNLVKQGTTSWRVYDAFTGASSATDENV